MRGNRAWAAALAAAAFWIGSAVDAGEQWSKEKAGAWAEARPWLVGCNYIPSTAINELEMWQADTFDPATIDRELGWAQALGFTSVRVFLHDIPFKVDRDGLYKRIDEFLKIADSHEIGAMFVLFDAVWDPFPAAGVQHAPRPGLHNSGWVQSPGVEILKDRARHGELEAYVKGIMGRYKSDPRVQAWDVFNEPDNRNNSSYGKDEPLNKAELSLALLRRAYGWAREVDPVQPITSAVWLGDWEPEKIPPMGKFQVEASDVVSFHDYSAPEKLKARVASLRAYGRPLLCTEYMARPARSTFDPCLKILKDEKVAAYNWGFVDGKSQTIYPWDSWQKPYSAEPPVWFHDIFRRDGTPYDPKEVAYIRGVTGKDR